MEGPTFSCFLIRFRLDEKFYVLALIVILFQMKTGDAHLSIGVGSELDVCEGTGTATSGSTRGNHSSTNGSIITMTLKNNHLIVETEERNVRFSWRCLQMNIFRCFGKDINRSLEKNINFIEINLDKQFPRLKI